jgi:predicted acyltransferase
MTVTDPDFARSVDADVVSRSMAAPTQRLLSLDVLRGVTLAFMIVVNNQVGPAPFTQLSHAVWNGFTATDLVFPTFLLLIGLSTVLSTASRLAKGATRQELFLHTLKRAALLIVFGFIVNNFPLFHMATARYYGVLPRIGICYFVVATLYLISPGWKDKVVLAVVCVVGYWMLMRFVAVPGFGVPTHGVAINDPDGNLTAWIDRQVFSPAHLYERTRDPEGLLSTLPAVATALFGMLAGLWLRTKETTTRKAAMLGVAGVILLALGLLWHPFFPINKKLWTSSFVLFAGGWSLLLLAASIYVVDVRRWGRTGDSNDPAPGAHPLLYQPALVLGTNSILAYMISETIEGLVRVVSPADVNVKAAIVRGITSVVPSTQWSSLVYALFFLAVCFLLVLPFYRKRIFLRI